MIHVEQAVIVEGRYDKMKLSSLIDGLIVAVDGFQIYKNREMQQFIRALAKKQGIIILTDGDAAGFQIRNYIKNIAGDGKVYHAYIPDIKGKERRKEKPSAEGKLGVEGIPADILRESFAGCGASVSYGEKRLQEITAADLFTCGISGGINSKERRKLLLSQMSLPEHLSSSMLLQCINSRWTKEEFYKVVQNLK